MYIPQVGHYSELVAQMDEVNCSDKSTDRLQVANKRRNFFSGSVSGVLCCAGPCASDYARLS